MFLHLWLLGFASIFFLKKLELMIRNIGRHNKYVHIYNYKKQKWAYVTWKSVISQFLEQRVRRFWKRRRTLFLSGQKFSKQNFQKTTFVIISLNFWNNQWNSRKNFFTVSMTGLHTWNNKIRSENWEKWSFVFFSLWKPIFVI